MESYIERFIQFWEEHSQLELILFAFALHGILAPFTGLDHDIRVWIQVTEDLATGQNPYVIGLSQGEYYAYPPLWAYILWSMRVLGELYGSNAFILRYIIKLPMILAQIGTALLGARIISQYSGLEKRATLTFTILVLNPFFFLIGSIWGMFDILPAFFCLAMIYLISEAPEERITAIHTVVGGICLAMAVLAKLYPIILLPIALIYLRARFQWVWFLTSFGGTIGLVCAPFFLLDPDAFLQIFRFHAERIGGGVTYWNGLWLLLSSGTISMETGMKWSGYYLVPFLGGLIVTYWSFWNAKHPSLVSGTVMAVWVFAFSFKLILEQYCVWILTFSIIYIVLAKKSERTRIIGILFIILVPSLYLIISIPLPDLFYIEIIRTQRALFLQLSFYNRQLLLFLFGTLFAGFHLFLWMGEFRKLVQK